MFSHVHSLFSAHVTQYYTHANTYTKFTTDAKCTPWFTVTYGWNCLVTVKQTSISYRTILRIRVYPASLIDKAHSHTANSDFKRKQMWGRRQTEGDGSWPHPGNKLSPGLPHPILLYATAQSRLLCPLVSSGCYPPALSSLMAISGA